MKSNEKEMFLFDLCDRYDPQKYATNKSVLCKLAGDRSPFVRSLVARVAAAYADDFMHDILMGLAGDRNDLVRVEAADSLSVYADETAYQQLMHMAQDQYYLVRGYAVNGIGVIGNTDERRAKSLAFIQDRLPKEHRNFNRLSCYQALYSLGEEAELQHMLRIYPKQNYRNQCYIINFLEEILSDETRDTIISFSERELKRCKVDSVRESLMRLLECNKKQTCPNTLGYMQE